LSFNLRVPVERWGYYFWIYRDEAMGPSIFPNPSSELKGESGETGKHIEEKVSYPAIQSARSLVS
jgi:hypothetical protein